MNYLVEGVIGTILTRRRRSLRRRRMRGALSASSRRRGRGARRCRSARSLAALLLFGVFVCARSARTRSRSTRCMYRGAFGTWFSLAEHAAARRAADADRAVRRAAGAARPGHHRRRGRAGARRPGRARRCATLLAAAADVVGIALMAAGRHARRAALWIALAGALRQYRGVNETISQPAAGLHRHRAVQPPRRRPAARSGEPEQAVDPRRSATPTCIGAIPRHRRALGPRRSASSPACVAWRADASARRSASRRAWSAATPRAAQLRGPAGRPADRRSPARSAAPAPAWPAWSRSRRCTAAPTPRSSPATATPASWSPSSRATTRWRSSRSRSCSAASAPAGGLLQRRLGPARRDRAGAAGHDLRRASWPARRFYGRFECFAARAAAEDRA